MYDGGGSTPQYNECNRIQTNRSIVRSDRHLELNWSESEDEAKTWTSFTSLTIYLVNVYVHTHKHTQTERKREISRYKHACRRSPVIVSNGDSHRYNELHYTALIKWWSDLLTYWLAGGRTSASLCPPIMTDCLIWWRDERMTKCARDEIGYNCFILSSG